MGTGMKAATRGVALVLVAITLTLVPWVAARQAETLDRLERLELQIQSAADPGAPTAGDPDLCWLLGAVAHAESRGSDLGKVLAGSRRMTDCAYAAQRGAMGEPASP